MKKLTLKTLELDGLSLSLDDVYNIAYHPELKVVLSKKAAKKMAESRNFILSKLKSKEPIYGVNTGFGLLSNVRIAPEKLDELQVNLIRSHAVGVGAPLSIPETRAAILLRAKNSKQRSF